MSTTQTINDEAARDLAANRTAGRRAVWLPMLGKEAKQLAPLLAVLVGCGIFLHLLGLFQHQVKYRQGFHATILALIPVLFAIGVGPILVSQEKEQRTLRWMVSLPVSPRSIVISKLIASLLGLIVIWCVSLAVTFAFCPSVLSVTSNVEVELLFWPGNTLFLLLMGFALAWILPTAGSTLVALLALTCAAGVFAVLANDASILNAALSDRVKFLSYLLSSYAVVTVIVAAVAIQVGKKSFVAKAKSKSSFAWVRNREQTRLTVDRTRTPSLSPASSLIWQAGLQNRMLWVGASFVLLMISASLAYALGFLDSKELLEFTPAVGCLVLSWLGASVFGSDARHGRIRFLAERGIAPTKIWWTRLALPFVGAILGVFAFLLPIQVWNFLHESHSRELRLNWTLDGQLMLRVLMIFGFAQWLPMWTRSTLIAICVSPVVAIFAILYIEFLQVFIASPWWLLVISIGLLFVATRVMLCPWMDGRRGLKYWLAQSALLIGVLTLPLVPFLITYATYSDMPAALRRELTEEVKAVRALQARSRISNASDPRK